MAERGTGPAGAVKAVIGGPVRGAGPSRRARTARPARLPRRAGREPGAAGGRGAGARGPRRAGRRPGGRGAGGGELRAGRAGGRRAGGGRGGAGSSRISSNSAEVCGGEDGEGELWGGVGAWRGRRQARGGDRAEVERGPREGERERERPEVEGEGGAGEGAADAAAAAPVGGGAAKATCPPSRSQEATDRVTWDPSVAPAVSTPWRVRTAGSMKDQSATRGETRLEPKYVF